MTGVCGVSSLAKDDRGYQATSFDYRLATLRHRPRRDHVRLVTGSLARAAYISCDGVDFAASYTDFHSTEARVLRRANANYVRIFYLGVQGAAAGAVAVWVMDRFDWFFFNHESNEARQRTETVRPGPGLDPAHALAAKVAEFAGNRLKPAPAHRHPAGLAVHYCVPIGLACLYLALQQRAPSVRKGRGALYGVGSYLLLDHLINPALGLAANPRRYPWQRNIRELLSHGIFGFIIESLLGPRARAAGGKFNAPSRALYRE